MFRGVEPVLITKQKIVMLSRAKPTVIEGVHVAIRVGYNPYLISRVEALLEESQGIKSRGIHSVNKVPRPNPPHYTYFH
jgi:hypothetical protein